MTEYAEGREPIKGNFAVEYVETRVYRPERRFGFAVSVIGREVGGNRVGVLQGDGEWILYEPSVAYPSEGVTPTLVIDDGQLLTDLVKGLLDAMRPDQRALLEDRLPAQREDLLKDAVSDARYVRDRVLDVALKGRVLTLGPERGPEMPS